MATTDWWEQLREPFPAAVIGKLPRVTCRDCSQNKQQRHCAKHALARCKVCGNYISEAHIHLDYVGHAATTDRLLRVDPEWTWRPMATEVDSGFPRFDSQGGLWILLTVKGVTRPGYGDGANPKEVISDAIRNAAMRFGVALDLWAKEDLQADAPEPKDDAAEETVRAAAANDETSRREGPAAKLVTPNQIRKMFAVAKGYGLKDDEIKSIIKQIADVDHTKEIPRYLMDPILQELERQGMGTPS